MREPEEVVTMSGQTLSRKMQISKYEHILQILSGKIVLCMQISVSSFSQNIQLF